MASEAHRSRYEPALDGLRALAVLAVMLYHGQVAWARGGFLGVDVFFVLSGYLITTLLLAEWARTGRIALRAFWARRARRLLPALLVVLGAVAAYAAVLAPQARLGRLRWDGLATLGYVANWRFVLSGQSYFDQFGDPSPLRHMWSLGIEEQFYLLWPLLLLLGLRLARGRLRLVLAAVVGGAAASAAAMALLWHPTADPSRAYYGTDTRAQALLIGAALALVLRRGASGRGVLPRPLAEAAGFAGLAVLAAMLVRVGDGDGWMYHGGYALAALASAALITALLHPGTLLRAACSLEPLRRLGMISYGMYLWHWPLYVMLTPLRVHLHGPALLLLRMGATVALAALSYALVEAPIRYGRVLARREQATVATASAVTATAFVLALATLGAQTVFPGPAAGATGQQGVALGDTGLGGGPAPQNLTPSQRGAGRTVRVYLVGDSVALTLAEGWQNGLVQGMRLDSSARVGCGVARATNYIDGHPQPVTYNCGVWPTEWRAAVVRLHPDVVLLFAGAWEVIDKILDGRVLKVGTAQYEAYLDSELELALEVLTDGSNRRVAMVNVPCYHEPDTGLDPWVAARNTPSRVAWLNGVFTRFAQRHPGRVAMLDLAGFLCPEGKYVDEMDGVEVRYDGVHFTPDGAEQVWHWLGPRLEALAPAAPRKPS